jgi:23S rRNA pseudouridine2605 synthase
VTPSSRARPSTAAPPVSLARALSKLGLASRAEGVRLVEAGRVSVNGRTVRDPALRVDLRRDKVALDGRVVREAEVERVVIAYHKPRGLIVTRRDPAGRPTIFDDLLDLPAPVFAVGRLDKDSSGLLVLTNDHRLGHRLTDPAAHLEKRYHVRLRGVPGPEVLAALREGVDIGDPTPTRPAGVRPLGSPREGGSWIEIALTEGRNRQIRRMAAAVGHDVQELVRVAIGGLPLGDLPSGGWRLLAPPEVSALLRER